MPSMKDLHALGQSVWLDFIRRNLVRKGELKQLVDGGLRGVTSNPLIFEKAISGGTEYDADLRAAIHADAETPVAALFEQLAITDIQEAADVLRPVWDESGGDDGYVSLEVSPHLAHDTAGSVQEAKRLWAETNRPNVMIKIPATPEGVPAMEELFAAGINVNATLMFSLAHYNAVADAYLRGLRRTADPRRIASVASFFVSRVDTLIDRKLEAMGTPAARALRGVAAIANAKLAYQSFLQVFHGPAFSALAARGARAQRVLFGSTSTKNPDYPDTKYVDGLIGPETVNTVPPETIDAFLDHGTARVTLTEAVDGARHSLVQLASLGIDMHDVTEELQRDGVRKFAESFDQLMQSLESKRSQLLTTSTAQSA